jgi:hypothetical protein
MLVVTEIVVGTAPTPELMTSLSAAELDGAVFASPK